MPNLPGAGRRVTPCASSSGSGPVPAVITPRMAVGPVGPPDPWCPYCGGRGVVQAAVPGTAYGPRVRCVCTQRTRAQRVMRAIALYHARHGYSPTVRDLANETGLPPSTVYGLLAKLVLARLIRRGHRTARSIEVR